MNRGKYIFFLFLLLGLTISFKGLCQKNGADSLKELLPYAASDTEKVNILTRIANYYNDHGELKEGMPYAFDALKLARAHGDPLHMANAEIAIDLLYWNNGQPDSALVFVKEAELYFVGLGPSKKLIKIYKNVAGVYSDLDQYPQAIDYYLKVVDLGVKLKDSLAIHYGYNSIGNLYNKNGEYRLSLDYYNKGLSASLAYKVYENVIADYVVIGTIDARQGSFPAALESYINALKANTEHTKNEKSEAIIYVNIGNVYNGEHDTAKAMKYYKNALALFDKINETDNVAVLLGNIGNIYMDAGDYPNAEKYQLQAMERISKTDDKEHLSISYINLGELYNKKGEYPKALEYYSKALEMQEASKDYEQESYTLSGLSTLYSKMGDDKKAEIFGLRGFQIAKSTHLTREVKDLGKILSDLYEKLKQPERELFFYKEYISARDSIDNKENSKKLIQSELNYEYEQKQQAEKLIDEKKDALNAEKAQHEKVIRNVYLGGFVLVLLLTILILRNFMRVRKANKIITEQNVVVEQQKTIVEQKNRDITDSINYAKRIQQAMLPTIQVWNNFFKQSFIYYKPKDIVSGDFYWCMPVGKDVIVAVADCTGHGVPGAFMSMLGVSSLNKIVGEKGIKEPGIILNMLRDEIIKSLNPEGKMEEVKDGMDMTLCYISKETGILEYAAANNPLLIMRKEGETYKVIESEVDKMPVGKYLEEGRLFASNKTEIKKGDRIYMFTDGYADQFGGEKGKKFKYRQLVDLLSTNQSKNMAEQKELLDKSMEAWKGKLEQVDDILIAGIEIV
jgi:serine phosphatase RsbU (regulator of sigma subunit)